MRKKISFLIISILLISCVSQKRNFKIYVLTEKANIHNIILKLNDNKRYYIQTQSTISGITEGKWKRVENFIKLMPDNPNISKEYLGDSLVDVQEFRPFSDTLTIIIKGKKLYFLKNGIINKNIYLKKIKTR